VSVLVTGGGGFLGSYVVERLRASGREPFVARRADYDLTRWDDAERLFADSKPELVIHLAAEVGGIGANRDNPGRYWYANLMMGAHVLELSRINGTRKVVTLGTICEYPKFTPVPFREEELWNGYPEETNAPYGIAKKTVLVGAQTYREQYGLHAIHLLPVNLYGPGDNFDLETSHVLPALVRKVHEAKSEGRTSITVWGTGTARREFLYSDDLADAVVFLMNLPAAAFENACRQDPPLLNIGCGEDLTIQELVELVMETVGYRGSVVYDTSKPDGTPRKLLDVSRMRSLGWSRRTPLREGLALFYQAFLREHCGGHV
jgi:GDP-L-fucose synthase